MWSKSKRHRCFRTSLLITNCASCLAILYIYLFYVGDQEKTNGLISSEDFNLPEKLTSENCTPVCDSRACMWHANLFLRYVNSAVDPCENFNSFLCSGFQREFGPLEKGNVIFNTKKPLLILLKDILDNLQAESGSASAKMKIVYDSCLNYSSSELQGIKELQNFFNKLGLVNWPHLSEDFKFGDVSLPIILANYITYGAKEFIHLNCMHCNETEEDRFKVSSSGYIFSSKVTEVSKELAVNMLKYFDLETESIDTIIEDYEFVRNSIRNFYKNRTYCTEENCPLVHIDCSRQNAEEWHDFCGTVGFVLDFINTDDKVIKKSIIIQEAEIKILKNLFSYLRSLPNRSLANFVALNFVKEYQTELNFYFRLSKLKHKDFMYEIEMEFYELDRWKYCVQWIADNMKLPLENEFFLQHLTKGATEEIIDIYTDFSSEIIDMIALQEWIPTELKSNLQEMVNTTAFSIDLVSRILPNDTYVNKVYEKFLPRSESFLSNAFQLKRFKFDTQSKIKSFNKEESTTYETLFEVNAYAGYRMLDFQFGMLIPPFYVPGHLSSMNHLLISSMTGHEFGHFICDTLVREADKILLEKIQCIEDQFSKYKFKYLNEYLNGSRYISESVPDNVGTALVDKIIEKYSISEDILLPGLPYSTKQLFYMSAAQIWCSKSSLKKDIHHKNEDVHAPDAFRLLVMMQNSRGHSEAFHCPVGSFMNPATKCSLLDNSNSN